MYRLHFSTLDSHQVIKFILFYYIGSFCYLRIIYNMFKIITRSKTFFLTLEFSEFHIIFSPLLKSKDCLLFYVLTKLQTITILSLKTYSTYAHFSAFPKAPILYPNSFPVSYILFQVLSVFLCKILSDFLRTSS